MAEDTFERCWIIRVVFLYVATVATQQASVNASTPSSGTHSVSVAVVAT